MTDTTTLSLSANTMVRFVSPEAEGFPIVIQAGPIGALKEVGKIHLQTEGGTWRVDFGPILNGREQPNFAICGSLEKARYVVQEALFDVADFS